jgi:hypothetical protein
MQDSVTTYVMKIGPLAGLEAGEKTAILAEQAMPTGTGVFAGGPGLV